MVYERLVYATEHTLQQAGTLISSDAQSQDTLSGSEKQQDRNH